MQQSSDDRVGTLTVTGLALKAKGWSGKSEEGGCRYIQLRESFARQALKKE